MAWLPKWSLVDRWDLAGPDTILRAILGQLLSTAPAVSYFNSIRGSSSTWGQCPYFSLKKDLEALKLVNNIFKLQFGLLRQRVDGRAPNPLPLNPPQPTPPNPLVPYCSTPTSFLYVGINHNQALDGWVKIWWFIRLQSGPKACLKNSHSFQNLQFISTGSFCPPSARHRQAKTTFADFGFHNWVFDE